MDERVYMGMNSSERSVFVIGSFEAVVCLNSGSLRVRSVFCLGCCMGSYPFTLVSPS